MTAWRLLIVMVLALALPAPLALSMTSDSEAEDQGSQSGTAGALGQFEDDRSETPPPAPDEVEDGRDTADDRRIAALIEADFRAQAAREQIDEVRAQLMALADYRDAAEMAAILRDIRISERYAQIPPELQQEVVEHAQTSASSSSAPALATAASSSAAPAALATERGEPAPAVAAQSSASSSSATNQIGEAEGVIPKKLEEFDLGVTEVRQNEQGLATVFRKHSSKDAIEGRTGKSGRRALVLQTLKESHEPLPSLSGARAGMMPVDLAEALVNLAQEQGVDEVKRLADPQDGYYRLAGLDDDADADAERPPRYRDVEDASPVQRLRALDALIAAARESARDYKPGSETYKQLFQIVVQARQDRNKLAEYLYNVLSSYPAAHASDVVSTSTLGEAFTGGASAKPMRAMFRFQDNSVAEPAVFKPNDPRPAGLGSLSEAGVNVNARAGKPLRLELRSLATREVANLLGIGDLVVETRVARLDDEGKTFGLIMERASGQPGMITTTEAPDPILTQRYNDAKALAVEAKGIFDILLANEHAKEKLSPLISDDMMNKFSTAADPADRDPTTFTREKWFREAGVLAGEFADMGIKEITQKLDDGTERRSLSITTRTTSLTETDLNDPDLRRQLSNAQWLDLLCGQVDRHMGNLMIDTAAEVPVVKLIDNDLAFGPNNTAYGLDTPQARPKFKLPPKPKTVDADFRKAFLALTEDQLLEKTRGLLSEAEQNALVDRLNMLKEYMKGGEVTIVTRPENSKKRSKNSKKGAPLTWDAPADQLFIVDPQNRPDPQQDDEYSYYSILEAFRVKTEAEAAQNAGNAP